MKKKKAKPAKRRRYVYTVLWTHKYGTDICTFTSRKKADKDVAAIRSSDEFVEETDYVESRISELI